MSAFHHPQYEIILSTQYLPPSSAFTQADKVIRRVSVQLHRQRAEDVAQQNLK